MQNVIIHCQFVNIMDAKQQLGCLDWLKCSNCCDETTQVDKQEIINNNNPENTVGKNSNLNLYANILNSEQDHTNNYNSGNILNYFNNNRANNNIERNDEYIEIEKNKKNPIKINTNFGLSSFTTVVVYNNENDEIEELNYDNNFTFDKQFNIYVNFYNATDKNKTARFIMNIYPENNTWHYSIRDAKTNKLVSSHDMEEKHAKTLDAIKKNACEQTEANKTNLNVIEINEEGCDKISYIINEIFNKLCEEQAAAARVCVQRFSVAHTHLPRQASGTSCY